MSENPSPVSKQLHPHVRMGFVGSERRPFYQPYANEDGERLGQASAAELHRLHTALAAREAEVERLKAIVDQLPITADGVRLIPGPDTWLWFGGSRYRANFVDNTIPVWVGPTVDEGHDVTIGECYSTEEAMLSATPEKC